MMDYAETVTAKRVKKVIEGYKATDDKVDIIYDMELKASDLVNASQYLEDAKNAKKIAKEEGRYSKVSNPKIVDNHLQVLATVKSNLEIEGTGGSFTYYELGDALFDEDGNLNNNVGIDKIREYIWFMETQQSLTDADTVNSFLGMYNDTAYYFNYNGNTVTVLDYEFLQTIQVRAASYIIYADSCLLSDDELDKYNITFKKIPRDIERL